MCSKECNKQWSSNGGSGPLTRYVKLRVAHAPVMTGTFSTQPPVSDPNMHHGTCVMHLLLCMPGALTSGFLWSRWRGKRSRHSWRMRNPQFYVSGERPMARGHHLIQCRSSLLTHMRHSASMNPCCFSVNFDSLLQRKQFTASLTFNNLII